MTAVHELRATVDPARLQALADALPIDRDGAALHCPSPGHDDDSASAGVFLATQAGAPHGRWKCQGCGAGGDAVELIRLALGLDFAEACRWLDAWLVEQPARPASRPQDQPPFPEAWVRRGLELPSRSERVARGFFRAKRMDVDPAWAVRERFVCVGVEQGGTRDALLFPWFANPGGGAGEALVGATKRYRARAGWEKYSLDGSQRRGRFYGEWRDEGREWVVLAEGETDALALVWWLRSRAVDVLGVAGASAELTDGMAARLAGRRVVFVPDQDKGAGPSAEWVQSWSARLAQEPRTDVAVAALPPGTDAVAAGEDEVLAALRSAARDERERRRPGRRCRRTGAPPLPRWAENPNPGPDQGAGANDHRSDSQGEQNG